MATKYVGSFSNIYLIVASPFSNVRGKKSKPVLYSFHVLYTDDGCGIALSVVHRTMTIPC